VIFFHLHLSKRYYLLGTFNFNTYFFLHRIKIVAINDLHRFNCSMTFQLFRLLLSAMPHLPLHFLWDGFDRAFNKKLNSVLFLIIEVVKLPIHMYIKKKYIEIHPPTHMTQILKENGARARIFKRLWSPGIDSKE
jgi:hypothetical protein